MSSFGVYLDSVATPIVTRVLVGLGFGVVSYVGVMQAFNALQTLILNSFTGMPASVASILFLAGFNQSVGIVLGAGATRVSMLVTKRLGII